MIYLTILQVVVLKGDKMKFLELSDSELEIMEVLWNKEEPLTFGELLNYFDTCTNKGWKKQTLNTFLFRMQQKKILQVTKEGRYKKYLPAITREEYKFAASRVFLEKNYQGSIVKMLASFNGGEKLEKSEIDELKKLLEEWENQ